jgi:hypothetical protein
MGPNDVGILFAGREAGTFHHRGMHDVAEFYKALGGGKQTGYLKDCQGNEGASLTKGKKQDDSCDCGSIKP